MSILISQDQIPKFLLAKSLVTANVEIIYGSDVNASFLISFLDNHSIVVSHDAFSSITFLFSKMKDYCPKKMLF